MINKKDWIKYSNMVDLHNDMKIEDCIQANIRLMKKKVGGIYVPVLMNKRIDSYLDWVTNGKKTFAKKLIVK